MVSTDKVFVVVVVEKKKNIVVNIVVLFNPGQSVCAFVSKSLHEPSCLQLW